MNKERVKKQVIVHQDLYNKVKGKMYAQGKTFSNWLEQQMKNELKSKNVKTS